MKSCEPRLQQLLAEQPGYEQAVRNLKSDCFSAGNPSANIPVAIEQSMKETCAADPDRPFTGIVEDHQTVRRPDDYPTCKPPGDRPLRRVVTRTSFLRRHLLPGPEHTEGYGGYEAHANLSETRERYQQILKSEPGSLDSILFLGTTGELGAPTWWTFLENGRKAPTDAVTYMEELMRGETSIENARSQGGVVVIIPAHVLADHTYKPCALDAFETDTGFRPDHSTKPYGVTCPVKPGLKGHPELISRSYRY